MAKRRNSRIYWRGGRAWADFRDFADVGGRQEALVADGEPFATEDPDVAAKLVAERIEQLEGLRRQSGILGVKGGAQLAEYAGEHLIKKRQEGTSPGHLEWSRGHLRVAIDYFGAGRELSSISTGEIAEWVRTLRKTPNGRGGTLSAATAIKYLNALSGPLRSSRVGRVRVPEPGSLALQKPTPERVEARYWDPEQVAALLEAARTQPADQVQGGREGAAQRSQARTRGSTRSWRPRRSRVPVRERSSASRSTTSRSGMAESSSGRTGGGTSRPGPSNRDVPLWRSSKRSSGVPPGARASRRAWVPALPVTPAQRRANAGQRGQGARSNRGRAGIERPRLHAFRHSYTAARLQTLEHGAPVHIWQVARELGHQSTKQIETRYGHLARVTERTEVVEFRVSGQRPLTKGTGGSSPRRDAQGEKSGSKKTAHRPTSRATPS